MKAIKDFIATVIFVVLILLFLNIAFAHEAPDPPCDFYGYEEEGDILKAGDVITAKDADGVACGSFTVVADGQYGFLTCKGPEEGDIITFYLNGEEVITRGIWTKGGTVRLDIGETLLEQSIDIHRSFNEICFSVIPQDLPMPYMASNLIQDMATQGITVNTVMQWDDGWISHRYDLAFTDFELKLDEGIFVKVVTDGRWHAGTWTIKGKKIKLPKELRLAHGWNLLAIPTTTTSNTVIELLQNINSQGGDVDTMMWWDGDDWISTRVDLPFTDQELIKGGRGYFIHSNSYFTWEME